MSNNIVLATDSHREQLMTLYKEQVGREFCAWDEDYPSTEVIHFAPAKKHIGLYPGPEAIEAFADKLVEYKTSKGAIQLPNDKDLPLELVADIARWSYENNRK